ncbi:hypothetical protein [Candidatus Carsonella ruddii]|uniref:Valyl-tRNA synthetase n=1 Tax=Carsonella ruddii TaxID=114186 RepID=A0A1U9RRT7_CARRU|nr:hypothetical protein [Candidatus Carsonella ruddii]AQU89612.1 Valyl-tRNA synthetase [Candidatus Carsonella ruddii]
MIKNIINKIFKINIKKIIFFFFFFFKYYIIKNVKKKINFKIKNIFYKCKNFINNKNIFFIKFFLNKIKKIFFIKNILNFKKYFFVLKENFKFFKKIKNFLFIFKKNLLINFKIFKKNKKRFFNFKNKNNENPNFIFFNYYCYLNLFLIKKNYKKIIIKKISSFNKIIFYNNILLLKIF